jgi:hypothetical protein
MIYQPLILIEEEIMDYQVILNKKKSNRILFSNLAYNAMRQYCGLSYALSFNDLTDSMDLSVIKRLASVYA